MTQEPGKRWNKKCLTISAKSGEPSPGSWSWFARHKVTSAEDEFYSAVDKVWSAAGAVSSGGCKVSSEFRFLFNAEIFIIVKLIAYVFFHTKRSFKKNKVQNRIY